MNLYPLILAVIILLALINLSTLSWVVWLQRRLREKDKAAAAIGRQLKVSRLALGPKWDDMLEQVEESAKQAAIESVGDISTIFRQDLATSSLKINQQLEERASGLVEQELARYQETLGELGNSTTKAIGKIQDVLDRQRQALETNLESEIKAKQESLMAEFDKRIAEVVSNYLIESLGTGIDLGAQSKYLFNTLDAHKAELKQEIMGAAK